MFSRNRYNVLAAEITKGASVACLISSDGAKLCIENLFNYSQKNLPETPKEPISRGYAVIGEEFGSFFHIVPRSKANIEINKNKHGITDDQYCDYMEFDDRGVLVSINKDKSTEALKKAEESFSTASEFLVGNSLICLFWGYCRSYKPTIEDRTLLVHVRPESLSAILAQGETPIWSGTLKITYRIDKNEWFRGISELIGAASEDLTKLASSKEFSRVILSGNFESSDCLTLSGRFKDKGNNITVELFKLNSGSFSFGSNIDLPIQEIETNFHCYAVAVFAASMMCEFTGIHTGEGYAELYRVYFKEPLNFKEEGLISKAAKAVSGLQNYTPLLLGQSSFAILAIIISLLIGGYRFWDDYKLNSNLDNQMTKEEKLAETFIDVRTKVNNYRQEIQLINQRIKLIDDISKDQMLVRTIALELGNRVPPGLKFSDVSIKGRDIRVRGYAPDRSAVMKFANDIGSSIGMFNNVNPIYDDKSDRGDYEISCQYAGSIPLYNSSVTKTLAEYKTTSK